MLGALQQMLPVLAGVSLPHALRVAQSSHLLLVAGTLSMFFGLLFTHTLLMIIAALTLFLGFAIIIAAIAIALFQVKHFNATVKAMSVSVLFATIIVLLGLHLLGTHASHAMTQTSMMLANVHSVWAIFGFAGVLVIGVSFQVLPMFYVTPAFKEFFTTYAMVAIAAALIAWLVLNMALSDIAVTAKLLIALLFAGFGIEILKKFRERKRKLSDVTVWYWHLSALCLILGLAIWSIDAFVENDLSTLTAVLIGGGFLLSVMNGMLYKIIPFLVWFHLNGMGYMNIPTMREMFDEKYARWQFYCHAAALLLLLLWTFNIVSVKAGALILFVSSALQLFNLVSALNVYKTTQKRPPDFDMSMMSS
jgi:hypothetical protein